MSDTAVAPNPTVVVLADLSMEDLSGRMGSLAVRHDALKSSVTEFETVKTDLSATMAEIQKRLGGAVAAPAKAKGTRAPRAKKEGDGKFPSLKEVVQIVLRKSPDGLELKAIVVEVQGMIDRGEYASGAKSLSAVVSQAVNALKGENLINHNRDKKTYTAAASAA